MALQPTQWTTPAEATSQWTDASGMTRYAGYDEPSITYDALFPYDGGMVANTSNYTTTETAAPNSWSDV